MEANNPCKLMTDDIDKYSKLTESGSNPDDITHHEIKNGSSVTYKNINFDEMSFHCILEKPENNFKHIEIKNCFFKHDVFINVEFESLSIEQCCFEGKFYINKQYNTPERLVKIENLSIKNSKFNSNFKLHSCEIQNFFLQDVDFERNADFFRTEFHTPDEIVFNAVNFRALALFGNTFFKGHLFFKYVTFEGYTHFREAEFRKGLNLDFSNIEKEISFFGIKGLDEKSSKEKTSRETYRTVKYHLQKVGNIIDANKYHVLELEKKREDVCDKACDTWFDFADCIVLLIHKVSSNYSTAWPLALFWILFVGFISSYVVTKDIFNPEFYKFSSVLTSLDDFCGIYWLFIVNKILLGYLYYQFVTAVRKDTRK
jgi:uncharacterized protein YjbI with pentapeptide repeats